VSAKAMPGAEPFRFDAGPIGAILIHGFSGSPASMRPLGRWLAERGVSSIGPRWPGHGTTWEDMENHGWRAWEREVEAALSDLEGLCRDVIAVGLSVGGAMALHVGARHADRLRGVAVINCDMRRPVLALAPLVRLFTRSVKGVINDINKPGQDEIGYDRLPVRALGQLGRFLRTVRRELPSIRLPLLLFTSPNDHVVKPSNSRYILERVGSSRKEVVTLFNSYHVATLDYDADLIFERILEFAHATAAAPREGGPAPA
jgi:carboxylesterase